MIPRNGTLYELSSSTTMGTDVHLGHQHSARHQESLRIGARVMVPLWLLDLRPSSLAMLCGKGMGRETEKGNKTPFHELSFVLVTDPCSKDLEVLRNWSLKYSVILNDLIPLAIWINEVWAYVKNSSTRRRKSAIFFCWQSQNKRQQIGVSKGKLHIHFNFKKHFQKTRAVFSPPVLFITLSKNYVSGTVQSTGDGE